MAAPAPNVKLADKDYQRWMRQAVKQDWQVSKTTQGVKLYPPGSGRPIPLHGNHSTGRLSDRVKNNQRAELRRAGLDI